MSMLQPTEIHPKMYMYKRIVEAKLYIDKNYADPINLNDVANQAAFSKFHFSRLFKQAFGKSPHKYLTQVRLMHAKELLCKTDSVEEVCLAVGFESVPSFTQLFKAHFNISPRNYAIDKNTLELRQRENPKAFIPNCFAQQLEIDK